MADPKLLNLLHALHATTMRSRLAWRRSEQDRVFHADVAGYRVQLAAYEHGDGYGLSVLDAEGRPLHEVGPNDFAPHPPEQLRSLFRQMHERAHSIAFGLDEALDAILAVLDQPSPDTPPATASSPDSPPPDAT